MKSRLYSRDQHVAGELELLPQEVVEVLLDQLETVREDHGVESRTLVERLDNPVAIVSVDLAVEHAGVKAESVKDDGGVAAVFLYGRTIWLYGNLGVIVPPPLRASAAGLGIRR